MALLHNARLTPSKLELLGSWLPSQPWWTGPGTPLTAVGAYRFDDPADEVGIETHLVTGSGGPVVQVPLTYRGTPLEGADSALVGTMQHSVLGPRWVYDACADPVYAAALAAAILTGGTEAELLIELDGRLQRREPTTRVTGSGRPGAAAPTVTVVTTTTDDSATTIGTPGLELQVRRVLTGVAPVGDALTLTGSWPGSDGAVILALARRR